MALGTRFMCFSGSGGEEGFLLFVFFFFFLNFSPLFNGKGFLSACETFFQNYFYHADMTVIASYTIKTTCGTKLEIPYDQAADRSLPFPEQARISG